jgi:hypothetical protein
LTSQAQPGAFSSPFSIISRSARKAGPLAKRGGDVFAQSRACSLGKGLGNAALARDSGRRPAPLLHPCISGSFDSVVPTPSPFGPTFGCSLTCIVPNAAPLWRQLSVVLPSAFPSFRFSPLPPCSIVVPPLFRLASQAQPRVSPFRGCHSASLRLAPSLHIRLPLGLCAGARVLCLSWLPKSIVKN